MDLVVFPAQTLCDAHRPPFLLPEQLQGPLGLVVVLCGDDFEHLLRDLHVPVLVFVVVIPKAVSVGAKGKEVSGVCVEVRTVTSSGLRR